jgi:hypothetical protein
MKFSTDTSSYIFHFRLAIAGSERQLLASFAILGSNFLQNPS